jgi:hypothetical protein
MKVKNQKRKLINMDMQEFIDNNRTKLSNIIWNTSPNIPLDDDELEMWINNDEGLYLWAKSEGVVDEEEEWECRYCRKLFTLDECEPIENDIYGNICNECNDILTEEKDETDKEEDE